jgi:hypothetical protein
LAISTYLYVPTAAIFFGALVGAVGHGLPLAC